MTSPILNPCDEERPGISETVWPAQDGTVQVVDRVMFPLALCVNNVVVEVVVVLVLVVLLVVVLVVGVGVVVLDVVLLSLAPATKWIKAAIAKPRIPDAMRKRNIRRATYE
jgi:hypothetical protein